jgi:hypothetical protein
VKYFTIGGYMTKERFFNFNKPIDGPYQFTDEKVEVERRKTPERRKIARRRNNGRYKRL